MDYMKNQKNKKSEETKIRTVVVNERGQIVIPDEIRRELGIGKGDALVLMQKGKEITMKKEREFLRGIKG
jgi:AbrB family looped-hinge helix DNA binding protein